MTLTPEAAVAAILGALLGLAADRLAARWPAHEDGGLRPVDWRSVVVVISAALAFGALSARWSDPRDLLVLGAYAAALVVLLATDLDQRLLPDVITLPLIVYAALVSVVFPLLGHEFNPLLAGKGLSSASAVAAGIGAPVLLGISDRLFHGALGGGDLKLSVSIGLMCGVSLLLLGFIVATTVFAAVVVLLVMSRRITLKTAIPFGPALIGAALVAFLVPA
jgi:leader peptidase (prepilin peptidase)/N-methyltransferase